MWARQRDHGHRAPFDALRRRHRHLPGRQASAASDAAQRESALIRGWGWGITMATVMKDRRMNRICHIDIDESDLPAPTPEMEQERRVAVFDLLEDNSFALPARDDRTVPQGPYRLALAIRDRRLVVDIAQEAGDKVAEFHLSLGPFRQVIKDYDQICASYFDAVKRLPPSQIEAIDMARRGIHNEGARVLQERLEGKAEIDLDTARRLFTLISVLNHGS